MLPQWSPKPVNHFNQWNLYKTSLKLSDYSALLQQFVPVNWFIQPQSTREWVFPLVPFGTIMKICCSLKTIWQQSTNATVFHFDDFIYISYRVYRASFLRKRFFSQTLGFIGVFIWYVTLIIICIYFACFRVPFVLIEVPWSSYFIIFEYLCVR